MKNIPKAICLLLILLLLPAAVPALEASAPESSDVSWAYYAKGSWGDADVFFIGSSPDPGAQEKTDLDTETEDLRADPDILDQALDIFSAKCRIFAPSYRQPGPEVFSLSEEEREKHFSGDYADIRAAFTEFLEVTGSRPFFLAGFSGGGEPALRLLKEYFPDGSLQDRLVAAYIIDWPLASDDLTGYPYLKAAEGRFDLGCIVSFTLDDAVQHDGSGARPEKLLYINPLNWKTDGTPADSSHNPGSRITDRHGRIVFQGKGLTGAYPTDRGTLRIDEAALSDTSANGGSYAYQFFFRSLQDNVTDRLYRWITYHGCSVCPFD